MSRVRARRHLIVYVLYMLDCVFDSSWKSGATIEDSNQREGEVGRIFQLYLMDLTGNHPASGHVVDEGM
jgi:hypothetical protein